MKKLGRNLVMIFLYVAVLLLGLLNMEEGQLIIYGFFIIVSAVIQYAILERLALDPLIQQNPLVMLSNYLFVTTAIAISGSQGGIFIEAAYLYVALLTAIYFELRVSLAITFLSVVSYGIIHQTMPHSDIYHVVGVVLMGVVLFSMTAILHSPKVRSKLDW